MTLPEDGQEPCATTTRRRGQKGQEEADVPVQQRGDEEDDYGQERPVSSLTFPLDPVSLNYNIQSLLPIVLQQSHVISGICRGS